MLATPTLFDWQSAISLTMRIRNRKKKKWRKVFRFNKFSAEY